MSLVVLLHLELTSLVATLFVSYLTWWFPSANSTWWLPKSNLIYLSLTLIHLTHTCFKSHIHLYYWPITNSRSHLNYFLYIPKCLYPSNLLSYPITWFISPKDASFLIIIYHKRRTTSRQSVASTLTPFSKKQHIWCGWGDLLSLSFSSCHSHPPSSWLGTISK